MIEDIKKHLENNCPSICGRKLNVNCLGEKSGSIIIKPVPCAEVIREYADGGMIKQYVFEICLRTNFDSDTRENIQTAVFMEEMKNWFCKSECINSLVLSDKKASAIEFEVLKTHGISSKDRSGAQHAIVVRLIYEE